MSAGRDRQPRVLLKARPVPTQLADRLAAPWADGLELYLAQEDIAKEHWCSRLVAEIESHKVPAGFAYVVEGPLRSLDGSFFDLSRDTPSNRETLRRTVEFGSAIGASAAVIHAIAPRESAEDFSDGLKAAALHRSLPLLTLYRDLCLEHSLIPTLENIPPVARMREGRFMHSIIGMEPADLIDLAGRVPGIRVTLDVSHAQLYLNAVNADRDEVPAEWQHLIAYIQSRASVRTLNEYITALGELPLEAHISNASGLCGEGLAYDEGDLDLDNVVLALSGTVKYLVTETIEPDAATATRMREAQRRIVQALKREAT